MSKEAFAFILTAVAVAAFFFTQKIQDVVNHHKAVYDRETVLRYSLYAVLPFVVVGIVAFTPSHSQSLMSQAERESHQLSAPKISADKLAIELTNNYYKINLIDTRSAAQFNQYHLPLSINIPVESMQNREWKKYFSQKYKANIFYADDAQTTAKAYSIAKQLGSADGSVLQETTNEFKQLILNPKALPASASKQEQQVYQFRTDAAQAISELDTKFKSQNCKVKKTTKKVKGGCS